MAYLGKTPSQAVRSRYYFTASGGETSLSGTDDNSNTLTFTDGNYVDVSLNGVALVAGSDYNTTTANTIGGLTALTASDVVEVVVYDTFSVFSGNVNSDFSVGGDLTITGTTTTSGNINFGDNDKAIFGAGSDLQIYHDGSNSFIKDAGPGSLQLHVSGLDVLNAAAGEFIIRAAEDGSVDLYHDNSKKLETTSTGIDVTGTVTADGLTVDNAGVVRLNPSSGDDFLTIQQGGSQAVITADSAAGAGNLVFRTTSAGSDTDTMLLAANGDISFYDNTGTTQGLFWDASTQRLGLGTSGPSTTLQVGDGSADTRSTFNPSSAFAIGVKNGANHGGFIGSNGSSGMQFSSSGGANRMVIDSSGNVGIGTASPGFPLTIENSANHLYLKQSNQDNGWLINTADADGQLHFYRRGEGASPSNNERVTISTSGNVGIGVINPVNKLVLPNQGYLAWQNSAGASETIAIRANTSDGLEFLTGSTRMTLDSSGNLLVGKTTQDTTTDGFQYRGDNDEVAMTRTNTPPLVINRLNNDGTLIVFRQQNTDEGSISVSGTTVSYNGGHLARWSQLADNTKDTSIVKGTVMTNLDQMAEWTKDGVTEDNEQLNCMAVSSVEGDANVAGVFVNWDDDDTDFTSDMNIAMTGDMVIRIASGTTVARGDLLMSAGDGTAKPQGDDIVRSKTIAKVTSTNVSHTYDDGSYLVPCVLMAC